MLITAKDIIYTEVEMPEDLFVNEPVDITDETIRERMKKVYSAMERESLDTLVIYADREHYGNFKYLCGFAPRFEEALLIVHRSGQNYLMLGNEMLGMAAHSRIMAEAVHTPHFSLPNQPMTEVAFAEILGRVGIVPESYLGVAGWKMFTGSTEDTKQLYDVPFYIVDGLKKLVTEKGQIRNATDIFIHPGYGVRTKVNANEIAYFEYGASLASSRVFHTLNRAAAEMTEMDIAEGLAAFGQPVTVQTICAGEDRFQNAVVQPRDRKICTGDAISATVGLCGGLTSRKAVMANGPQDLRKEDKEYVEEMVKPYFAAAATWYSSICVGKKAGELYDLIEQCVPKSTYGWTLNPGHLTGEEEWLSSPVYPGSDIILESGEMLQMDIILSRKGCKGANAEDGIVIADASLRKQLKEQYPKVWERMQARRVYMTEKLNIPLHPDVLPLSNTAGYFRPYILNHEKAMKRLAVSEG